MRHSDIERQIRDTASTAGNRARQYVDGASDTAQTLLERGRRHLDNRLGNSRRYGRQLARVGEDLADEANYRYRRLRRQVGRHPAATVAIVAGTVGAFLLLYRAFRSDDD